MSAPLNLWVVRVLWLTLPFTLLEAIEDAAGGANDATRLTAQSLFWVLWAVTFMVSLLPCRRHSPLCASSYHLPRSRRCWRRS
ncbi:MAG: hypothetical protein M5U19_19365 [Microthrixaceae bacterium]|nr:hypothetical protein [Microthrixaceae bacterium]